MASTEPDASPTSATGPRQTAFRRREAETAPRSSVDGLAAANRRAIRAMAADPRLLARMLAMHVGELSPFAFASNGLALGWRMLTV